MLWQSFRNTIRSVKRQVYVFESDKFDLIYMLIFISLGKIVL